MNRIPGDIDRLAVAFDEESLVSDAGLLAVGTLMKRLGLEGLLDGTVRMGGRVGGSRPGRKILSLVVSMLLGGSHIDHADRLRAGSTRRVLPFRVMASSTLGTFLRSFTWGHVRQLDKALGETLRRFWSAGGGPKDGPVTVDVDGTVCEVVGKTKHGAAYGYTGKLGYHPLVAAVSETGEIVHARMRGGSSRKGHAHFIVEAVNRTRRAGATGPVIVRADSEFWSYRLVEELDDMGVEWSITLSQYPHVREAIANITEDGWEPIGYTEDGEAQVAETSFVASKKKGKHRRVRVVVRRTRWIPPKRNCGPTGDTTPSPPAPNCPLPKRTPFTGPMPEWSWPSGTSKPTPVSHTAPRGTSSPTPPGWPARYWLTTSTDGQNTTPARSDN